MLTEEDWELAKVVTDAVLTARKLSLCYGDVYYKLRQCMETLLAPEYEQDAVTLAVNLMEEHAPFSCSLRLSLLTARDRLAAIQG